MISTDQKPLGSGFAAKSEPSQILKGINLAGKTAIVTGGYSGIGFETSKALAEAGAEVVIAGRSAEKGREAAEAIGHGARSAVVDLADLGSVRAFAEDFVAQNTPLHLLINNAGIMACPETRLGDGWEAQFAINHLGHFALTEKLAPALKDANGARVVALSSAGHKISPIRFDDPHFSHGAYDKWAAYGQSKTANALFAVGLDQRMKDDGVRAFSLHPGGIKTPLQRHLDNEEMVALGWTNPDGTLSEAPQAMFKSPSQGATTTLWAATSPMLDGKGGLYCEDCEVAQVGDENSPRHAHVMPHAVDQDQAAKLWDLTEEMLAG